MSSLVPATREIVERVEYLESIEDTDEWNDELGEELVSIVKGTNFHEPVTIDQLVAEGVVSDICPSTDEEIIVKSNLIVRNVLEKNSHGLMVGICPCFLT